MSAVEERRLASSLRLLVAAGRELAASFDYAETLAAVGRVVVPAVADGFSVELDEGEIRTTLASTGRLKGPVRTIPLVARGRTLGVMRVAVRRDRDGSAADTIDLWDELALRIAVSVDAAQVYAREHHVADTLQRALLPEGLPVDDRVSFDAAYRPGTDEAIVGGDWYDAFRLPDGRIAFSIGDVAGHGLRAAIVMGEVRQTFRAAVLNPNSPSLVLERANTIVNMRSNPVMVTAIFGIIEPNENVVTYACAGHPSPVLALVDGAVQFLPKDGLPLGIGDEIGASDWTFTIPPGAQLALYTDGLIEHSRDVVAGEAELLDAVSTNARSAAEDQPARALLERVFTGRDNTDDVAALTITSADAPSTTFTFTFSALPMAVPMVRRSLRRFLERLALDDDRIFAILTATGEAVANSVEHAYGGSPGIVRLRAQANGTSVIVSVEDEGSWKPVQRRDERGRGLPLMRALVDAVEIRTHHARTEVRLTIRG